MWNSSPIFSSYEEHVLPFLRASYFPDFTIYKRQHVVALISLLPDDPHAEMPKTRDNGVQKQRNEVDIFIMSDERKASDYENHTEKKQP